MKGWLVGTAMLLFMFPNAMLETYLCLMGLDPSWEGLQLQSEPETGATNFTTPQKGSSGATLRTLSTGAFVVRLLMGSLTRTVWGIVPPK